jgi:CDP-diacylglycerol--serine O-phosphatidyltransferase
MSDPASPKIYLLPNLMTAGNFSAALQRRSRFSKARSSRWPPLRRHWKRSKPRPAEKFHLAIWLILASCIFDLLDGRLARLGGNESAFGREFDSLADVVSFGVAPALMVYRIVLHEFPRTGWLIASLYLVCGRCGWPASIASPP